MRKLLPLTVCCIALACTGGWSFAALAPKGEARTAAARLALAGERGSAAVTLPAQPPRPDAVQEGAYGYQSSARIAAGMQADAAPGSGAAATGSSATVVVTATVLPVRTIVVEDGRVTGVWSNTGDLRARESLYSVRDGSLDGPVTTLSPEVWAQARTLLARSNVATGRIA
jgi:hypothetical protein